LGVTPIPGRFVSEGQQVRHDADKLAQALVKLIVERADAIGLSASRKPVRIPATPAAPFKSDYPGPG
jgi:hypothetical protein